MPSESGLCQMISPLLLSYLLLRSKQRHSSCCQLFWRPHESLALSRLWGPVLQAFMFLFVRLCSQYAYCSLQLGFSFLFWAVLLAPSCPFFTFGKLSKNILWRYSIWHCWSLQHCCCWQTIHTHIRQLSLWNGRLNMGSKWLFKYGLA